MKLCTDGIIDTKAVRFKDLKRGDVFKWRAQGSPMVMIVTNPGRGWTCLIAGTDYGNVAGHASSNYTDNARVVWYPNACVRLGDPE